jgi:hypothetical protein
MAQILRISGIIKGKPTIFPDFRLQFELSIVTSRLMIGCIMQAFLSFMMQFATGWN